MTNRSLPQALAGGSRLPVQQDPARVREMLARALAVDERDAEIGECRVGPARRRAGFRLAVQYDLVVTGPASGAATRQIVTGVTYGNRQTRQVWKALRAKEPAAARPGPLPPFACAPELDMLRQVFPHDHRLPALARLFAGPPPELEAAILERFGGGGRCTTVPPAPRTTTRSRRRGDSERSRRIPHGIPFRGLPGAGIVCDHAPA